MRIPRTAPSMKGFQGHHAKEKFKFTIGTIEKNLPYLRRLTAETGINRYEQGGLEQNSPVVENFGNPYLLYNPNYQSIIVSIG